MFNLSNAPLMFPQNGIKHKAAITGHNQCLLLFIAALYLFCVLGI